MFTLICRSNQELKERHYTFTISSEDVQKEQFLRTLCRQMAHVTCRADAVGDAWGRGMRCFWTAACFCLGSWH